MLLQGLVERLTGKNKQAWKEGKIRGTAVLVKSDVLDLNDFNASLLDGVHKILGRDDGFIFHLISATAPDPQNPRRGKVGKAAHLEEMVVTMKSTAAGESVFKVTFDWDDSQGVPGAVIVRNTYRSEYLLKTLTLHGVPGKGTVVLVANSWIYPNVDRVFFANDVLLMEDQNQSYFDLLHSDVGLNDLHWTEEQRVDLEGHEEQQTDIEEHEEQQNDLEGPEESTPHVKARSSRAKAKKVSASKRQKNFSKAEDLTLVDAYLEITQDPIIGVDQSRDCYWKRIDAYFHVNKSEDHGRTQGSLQHRWAIIQEQVNRFCACYAQVLNRNQSGMTRDNKLCQALVLYANGDKANKSFGLMHCFNKLEDTEKWKSKRQERFELMIAMETRESKRQERFELMIAMDKQREEDRLVEERKKLAIQEKKMELEEEKIRIMRMAEERMMGVEESKIMSMDLTGMDEQEQEFYKLRKSQIINRHRNSSA